MGKLMMSRRTLLEASALAAITAALGTGCSSALEDDAASDEASSGTEEEVKVIRTVCSPNCAGACGINAYVRGNTILKVEPAEFPDDSYMRRICAKGIAYAMQRVTHADRIKTPMRRVEGTERGAGEWEEISWEEAIDELAGKFADITDEYGAQSIATAYMTGNMAELTMMVPSRINNLIGATNISQSGLMSDGALTVAFFNVFGAYDTGHSWYDMEGTNFFLSVAANFADTMINDFRYVLDNQERGMKYVQLDPRLSHSAAKADTWVPLRPGTDAAFLLGMTQYIIENNWHDAEYLETHTNAPILVRPDTGQLVRLADIGEDGEGFVGWNASSKAPVQIGADDGCEILGTYTVEIEGSHMECPTAFQLLVDELNSQYTPDQAAEICEVDADVIRDVADGYANQGPSAIRMGQGSQRYYGGHQAFACALTLAMVCGNLGKEHAGVSWCGGALGEAYFAVPGEWFMPNPNITELPAAIKGQTMWDRLRTDDPYPIKALWTMQYGFGTQIPRRKEFFEEVLPNLDYFVVSETVMTPAAKYADLILPVSTFYEDNSEDVIPGATHKVLQLRHQAITPIWDTKTDWEIGQMLAEKMGVLDGWNAYGETIADNLTWVFENANSAPTKNADLDYIREKGVGPLAVDQPYVEFKDFYDDPVANPLGTNTGRFNLYWENQVAVGEPLPCHVEPLESNRTANASKYPLTMMTCHEYFTAHGNHTILPWIREIVPEPRIEMNSQDAEERGLADGDTVRVYNDRGEFKVKMQVFEGIKPGCVNLAEGWWPDHFENGEHYGDLAQYTSNPVQENVTETNWAPYDNLVQIEKA